MKTITDTIKLLENSWFYYSLVIRMDNIYHYVSPHYNRNFDFLNESLTGKPFYITLHPDDIKICREVGAKCFEKPEALFPATLRKHDGKGGFVVTQWEFKAVFDTDGQPFGIFCIGHNITELVIASNRLDNAIAEIEEKTNQLNDIGFMQSHVVRKPLANIMGLANILTKMEVDHNLLGITNMMISSANELDTAVKSISDMTDDQK